VATVLFVSLTQLACIAHWKFIGC